MSDVTCKLSELGYTIHARQMPAVGNPNPPKDLSEDIAAMDAMVEEAIGTAGNDVIVMCHSWGGIVTGSGLKGLSKTEREKQGKKGGVVRTGYIAAFIVDEGVSLLDGLGGSRPSWSTVEGPYIHPHDPAIFYNDMPTAVQAQLFAQIKPHAFSTFVAKSSGTSWKHIPTSYLLCANDVAIPPQAQQGMIDGVQALGADVHVTRIEAGHSPFFSKVGETVAWVRRVSGEKM
ncbi:hypothetical protein BDU57DRAFT_444523 [Ampelomyces quisqualis]|uniref:AB hydrolase-1 domain-containing protein n=1 Tax=Ampelomyces quisqualis TaxID=50730 RepID=A0A6A5QRR8_AMPQU|nr:hypothetical protein BDU57DRAFT_444523 [Ampelomyces quisqualis]